MKSLWPGSSVRRSDPQRLKAADSAGASGTAEAVPFHNRTRTNLDQSFPNEERTRFRGVQLDGIFRLHGTEHPMTLTLPVQVKGTSLSARTPIVIPYVAWGPKNPSKFLLRVSDKVDIDITAAGRVLPMQSQPADDH
jgi:hypothetical protein